MELRMRNRNYEQMMSIVTTPPEKLFEDFDKAAKFSRSIINAQDITFVVKTPNVEIFVLFLRNADKKVFPHHRLETGITEARLHKLEDIIDIMQAAAARFHEISAIKYEQNLAVEGDILDSVRLPLIQKVMRAF